MTLRRLLPIFICFLLSAPLLSAIPSSVKTNRSILILNAYHSGYEWSDQETRGIIDALEDLEQPPVVYIEYLDTKRHISEEHFLRMRDHLLKTYSHLELDLIIAQDNWSLDFIQRFRNELFPNVNVVFCGINGKTPEDLNNLDHMTGLLERHDLLNTINMALSIHPKTKQVYLLHDTTISSQQEYSKLVREGLSNPNVEIRHIYDFSWDKISDSVSQIPKDSVLILSTSIVDKYSRVLSGKDIGRIIARNANVPIYTTLDIFMDEGIIGGHLLSAHDHGYKTGLIAKEILEGVSTTSIPVDFDTSYQWVFNYQSLKHWNISKSQLPEESTIQGEPRGYAHILWWVIPGVVFILVQSALIMFLLIARSRWKTAVREIREREKHLTLMIEHTPMPMTVLNINLEYEYVNQNFIDTFGYSEKDLLNFHLSTRRMASSEDELGKASLQMKSFFEDGFEQKEFVFIATTKHRKKLYVETCYSRVGDKIIIAYHDITTRILIEENLKNARDAERSANKAKSQFLANMSHEIRTPMNAVLGMAQLLNQTPLDEEQKDYINTILNSGELLLAVINDLLDLSKIEAGHLEIETHPLDLRTCIMQCARLMDGNFKNKKLQFSSHISENCPHTIYGDQNRIQQILLNLLNNACKYTEKGSVELSIDASPLGNDAASIVIHVKDTGIGISEENLKTIFKPFNQGDSSNTRKYGGTGLGLTIVKRMVTIMGGRIDVNSKENVGSIFTVTIPVKIGKGDMEPLAKQETDTPSSNGHFKFNHDNISILLTEDNDVNVKLTKIILKKLGLKADIAQNGKEAIEMLKNKRYDIVLMDIQMPVMDGTTATQIIREEFSKEQQPYIIAMTAHAMASDAERFLRSGMNDYISKPIKINLLQKALQNAFQLVQLK